MKNFTPAEEYTIVSAYQSGISKNKLRKQFNVSEGVIKRILLKNNIELRTPQQYHQRQYNLNDNYFDIQSENMAYIMGLWAADGNVGQTNNRLDLELNAGDIDILEAIRVELQSERPIKQYQCQNGYVKAKLLFWSNHIKEIFGDYGIVPNKTYSPNFHAPYLLDKKYWIDYIRGFFDGDGCVKKASSLTFELNSINKQFLIDFQNFFAEYYNISLQLSVAHALPNQHIMYRLYGYGDTAKVIFNLMYHNLTSLYMPRKYQRWLQLLK